MYNQPIVHFRSFFVVLQLLRFTGCFVHALQVFQEICGPLFYPLLYTSFAIKKKPMIMGKISVFSQNEVQSRAMFIEGIEKHMQKIW